jgi:ABC-type transport system involved in multi-copper enzyme maturation permease subunit
MADLLETQVAPLADERSTPSRVATTPSDWIRTVGMAGGIFFLVGIVLWLWNVVELSAAASTTTTEPRFRWMVIRLWLALGILAMLYHAVKDGTRTYRRLYGALAAGLTLTGMVLLTYFAVAQGIIQAAAVSGYPPDELLLRSRMWGGAAAGLVGLATWLVAMAPFVVAVSQALEGPAVTPLNYFGRLWSCARKDSVLLQLLAGGLALIGLLVAGAILLHMPLRDLALRIDKLSPENLLGYGLLPYGLFLCLLATPFGMILARQEDEAAWRHSVAYLIGFAGALTGLAGMGTLFTDLTPLGDLLAPYGLMLLFLSFIQLWAFISSVGPDSDIGYRTAQVVRLVGMGVFLAACGRSLYPSVAEWLERGDVPSYLVPNGFLLMVAGLIFAFFGYAATSDSKVIVLTRRELAAYFFSPIAYMVVGGVTLVAWLQFLQWVDVVQIASVEAVPEPIVRYFLFSFWSVIALIAVIPMLTMRLLSEEQRTGTMELLLTAPINEGTIVLAKFLAAWLMFLIAWSVWLVFALVLRVVGQESFDYRPLLSFYLGLAFMSAGFLAMGLFFSSLTKNQIIAYLLGLAGMALLLTPFFLIEDLRGAATTWADLWRYLSFVHHMMGYIQGRLELKYLTLYVSFAAFWLFLTVKVLEARKWR